MWYLLMLFYLLLQPNREQLQEDYHLWSDFQANQFQKQVLFFNLLSQFPVMLLSCLIFSHIRNPLWVGFHSEELMVVQRNLLKIALKCSTCVFVSNYAWSLIRASNVWNLYRAWSLPRPEIWFANSWNQGYLVIVVLNPIRIIWMSFIHSGMNQSILVLDSGHSACPQYLLSYKYQKKKLNVASLAEVIVQPWVFMLLQRVERRKRS